jgi:hypothetical protein
MEYQQLAGSWWLQGATQSYGAQETENALATYFFCNIVPRVPRHSQQTAVCMCRVTAGVNDNGAEGAREHENVQQRILVPPQIRACVAVYI